MEAIDKSNANISSVSFNVAAIFSWGGGGGGGISTYGVLLYAKIAKFLRDSDSESVWFDTFFSLKMLPEMTRCQGKDDFFVFDTPRAHR